MADKIDIRDIDPGVLRIMWAADGEGIDLRIDAPTVPYLLPRLPVLMLVNKKTEAKTISDWHLVTDSSRTRLILALHKHGIGFTETSEKIIIDDELMIKITFVSSWNALEDRSFTVDTITINSSGTVTSLNHGVRHHIRNKSPLTNERNPGITLSKNPLECIRYCQLAVNIGGTGTIYGSDVFHHVRKNAEGLSTLDPQVVWLALRESYNVCVSQDTLIQWLRLMKKGLIFGHLDLSISSKYWTGTKVLNDLEQSIVIWLMAQANNKVEMLKTIKHMVGSMKGPDRDVIAAFDWVLEHQDAIETNVESRSIVHQIGTLKSIRHALCWLFVRSETHRRAVGTLTLIKAIRGNRAEYSKVPITLEDVIKLTHDLPSAKDRYARLVGLWCDADFSYTRDELLNAKIVDDTMDMSWAN